MKNLVYLALLAVMPAARPAPLRAIPASLDTNIVTPIDTSDFIPVERVAEFEGGDAAWNDWMRSQLTKRLRYLQKNNAYGSAEVQFIVEKDGRVDDVRILKSSGTRLDDVVLEIMRRCPRWSPALKHDHTPVRAFRRQWFTLQPPN